MLLARSLARAIRLAAKADFSPEMTATLKAAEREPYDDLHLLAFSDAYEEHYGDDDPLPNAIRKAVADQEENPDEANRWVRHWDLAHYADPEQSLPLGNHRGLDYYLTDLGVGAGSDLVLTALRPRAGYGFHFEITPEKREEFQKRWSHLLEGEGGSLNDRLDSYLRALSQEQFRYEP